MSEVNQYGATREGIQRYADSFNNSELLEFFGIRLEFPDLDTVWAIIDDPKTGHKGGMGEGATFNGGVLAALYDLVVGCAAATVDPARRAATIQLSMNFESPVIGDYVRAEAKVDRAGKTLVFVSAKVVDGEGRVCSHGQGVVRMSRDGWRGDSPADTGDR